MYDKITAEDPYQTPMMIYPAAHYTTLGLWVDYNLVSTVPGLFVLGEANFSDHGANRLAASALMQGLAKARGMIQELRAEFWENVAVPITDKDFYQTNQRECEAK